MNLYKVIFANNDIISCEVAEQRFDHESEYYFEYKGQLIHAMIKGENKSEALDKANEIIKEELEKYKNGGPLSVAA